MEPFDSLQKTWTNYGKDEPFWSVLTCDGFLKQNIDDGTIKDFYASGHIACNLLINTLEKHNLTIKDKTIIDYGCGVGRITKHLASYGKKVYGVDISPDHLEIASKYVTENNVEFICLNENIDLPKSDIVYSLIVLQHCEPGIMIHCINKILQNLNEKGIALLHIPYFIPNYEDRKNQSNSMEMHYIPKEKVKELTFINKCILLDIIEIDHCGHGVLNCLYLIQK